VAKFAKMLLVLCVVLVLAAPAMAQPGATGTTGPGAGPGAGAPWTLINLTNYLGVGLVVIGAAFGISRLASSAYDGMSRQPEVAGNIQTAMIIAAALIEGFTFYALYICSTVAA
jgi:F-type H+-transporting ATPase subunit c